MPKEIRNLSLLCAVAWTISALVMAAEKDHYLHIQVNDPAKGESVNVNVPLSMAEKILLTVNKGNLHQGRVTISRENLDGLDLRVILDTIRTAPDNEFVIVKRHGQNVRAGKSNGSLVVHVREAGEGGRNVDIAVPMKVVDALFSTVKKDELDVAAAIRALSEAGDTLLVSVQDAAQQVRIWVDSPSSQD
jgi:hypothetical protein